MGCNCADRQKPTCSRNSEGSPWWNGDPFARTPRRFTTGRPSSAYRLLSDLRDYGVDVPYIQAHIHGLSSRSVLYLDDSLTVLRDEEVDGPVSVVVSFPCVLHCSRPGISPWRAA